MQKAHIYVYVYVLVYRKHIHIYMCMCFLYGEMFKKIPVWTFGIVFVQFQAFGRM